MAAPREGPTDDLCRFARGPGFARTMARYNTEMNRRLIAAAGRLADEERRRDRGAFWRSIRGAFSHLVWADRMWMSRFAGSGETFDQHRDSDRLVADFETLERARSTPGLSTGPRRSIRPGSRATSSGSAAPWHGAPAEGLPAGAFLQPPRPSILDPIHAMLTAAGEATGDTDLFIVEGP